ncbi:hypothetical protein ACFE04_003055 [Oxalis oulophora]
MDMDVVWQTPANLPQRHDYIIRDGRRHVRPYFFEFISHVKNRWAGKTIVDMFAQEFKGRPYDYYVSAVKCGRIQVDGEIVPVSYVIKPSQKISHFLHRHEPPVMPWDVLILHKDPDVLTVCKPASVPVHPCGQYAKNTVVGILQAEHGFPPLFRILVIVPVFGVGFKESVHRLDRLVSGLLIIARNAKKADEFRQQIEGMMVKKQYIARVLGLFPEDEKKYLQFAVALNVQENVYSNSELAEQSWFIWFNVQVVDANINYNAREGRSTTEVGDDRCGKAACTKFKRISTNGSHSIVLCEPITGRTHQIRAHLQYAGYPIANDVLYLYEHVGERSNRATSADRAAANLRCSENSNNHCEKENPVDDFDIDPMCTHCPNLCPNGYEGHEEGLWLHCVRYSGPDWTYECPYPDWASLD